MDASPHGDPILVRSKVIAGSMALRVMARRKAMCEDTTSQSHTNCLCAVLCCAVLCCAVLCCAVLCCAVLCCAVLCYAVLAVSSMSELSSPGVHIAQETNSNLAGAGELFNHYAEAVQQSTRHPHSCLPTAKKEQSFYILVLLVSCQGNLAKIILPCLWRNLPVKSKIVCVGDFSSLWV